MSGFFIAYLYGVNVSRFDTMLWLIVSNGSGHVESMHRDRIKVVDMTLVVKMITDESNLKYKKIIDAYTLNVMQLIDIYKEYELDPEIDNSEMNKRLFEDFLENSKYFSKDVFEFIKDKNNKNYLYLDVGGHNLEQRLDRLFQVFVRIGSRGERLSAPRFPIIRQLNNLNNFISWFHIYEELVEKQKESDKLVSELTASVEVAKEQAKNFETAIQALNAEESVVVYTSASTNFIEQARAYELLFYLLLGVAILFTTVHLCYVPFSGNEINFILVKAITLSIVVTLGTLFLRKSAHFQKLYDQAHQTSLELKALPLYLKNVEKEHHSDIYKDLASKYFGKDIDPSQNDKIGDLIKDQLTAGTELIKASAELVKNAKTVNENAELLKKAD